MAAIHGNQRQHSGWLRQGSPWRDLPEVFGDWNTVFRRFSADANHRRNLMLSIGT